MEKEKTSNPLWNVLKTEWEFLGNKKKIFLVYMSFFAIAGIINLLTPLLIGSIFNSIQNNISSETELNGLIFKIFLILAITIGFWIFHGTGRIMEYLTGYQVHRNYTNSKIRKILDLPVKWHKDNHSGDTIDKLERGRTALFNFSGGTTYDIVYGVLSIFGSIFILFFIDKKIAIFTLVFALATIFTIMKVDSKLHKYYKELNKYSNKLSASIYDYVSNTITVITLRLKGTVADEIDSKLAASYKTERTSSVLNEFKWGFASVALSLMTVLVLSYKAYTDYHTNGIILIGTLYILYGYLDKVGESFFRFAGLYGALVRFDARIRGAYPIDEAYALIEKKEGGKISPDWKNVEFKDVDFTYDKEGKKQHIDKVSIKFRRGEKVALIGESGSGKSTILALIRGLYEPDSGEVYVNGIKVENGFGKVRKKITLIPQDPEIFNNTLKYNITMDLPAKKEDVQKVIAMAQFGKVIERLEKGLETSVMEKGVSLSGGEKQRLALARGLLAAKKSQIVLMDEPTSSVDSNNEMKIYDSIFSNFKDKTVISSVHKLNLLEKFDYVYMFDRGKIIASGTFNELKKNPRFASIWKKYITGRKEK
ncbi:hypothetical protein AUJ84_00025 [Candidatus Pacearchaeota archaeon CG1_02_32_132]|nr:MAG: hypothetical protein AUJ84_00025 [Candidatus Pacearchaeota archaeon CG1_02_32_132]